MQLVPARNSLDQLGDGLPGPPDFRFQVRHVYGNQFLDGRNLALQLDAQGIELARRDIEATQILALELVRGFALLEVREKVRSICPKRRAYSRSSWSCSGVTDTRVW